MAGPSQKFCMSKAVLNFCSFQVNSLDDKFKVNCGKGSCAGCSFKRGPEYSEEPESIFELYILTKGTCVSSRQSQNFQLDGL